MESTNRNLTDLKYLKELANGDLHFINEMITVFLDQTPAAIDQLEKYCNEKNWKMLRSVAHKFKPSFSFVGLKELSGIIHSIEEYAENETHLDLLPEMIARVKASCIKAMAELEEQKKDFSQDV
jgi:HPt (histidine-containing phosphotransfer) domain-containing protein